MRSVLLILVLCLFFSTMQGRILANMAFAGFINNDAYNNISLSHHDSYPDTDTSQIRRELDFILYLIGREDYNESIFLLERIQPSDQNLLDSVNYLAGWVYYRQKSLNQSATRLLLVSENSPVYYKSRFFGAYNLAFMENRKQALGVLSSISPESGGLIEAMRNFQLAGVYLLERDYNSFEKHSDNFIGQHHVMAQQERSLNEYYRLLHQARAPSPFVAGLFSAVIPGLGRVYAGKTAEGIVSFLYMAALGFSAWDFYSGAGIRSPLFIISASVSAIFYAGNIVGSAAAARRINKEFNHEMDQRILFDLHIPLRNIFN